MLFNWWDAVEANLHQADTASLKALELAPQLAEAHASRGFALTLSKRYAEAEAEFETAIRLDPTLFEAYYFYARSCFEQGKLEPAAELFEKAGGVRPEDFQALGFCSQVYSGLGRQADADDARRRTVERVEKHLELNPEDPRACILGAATYANMHDAERAIQLTERAMAVDPEDPMLLYNVACVYAQLDKIDESLAALERAVEKGWGDKNWIEHDSDLIPLRSNPRFQAIVSSM